jgi:hypothetical protein
LPAGGGGEDGAGGSDEKKRRDAATAKPLLLVRLRHAPYTQLPAMNFGLDRANADCHLSSRRDDAAFANSISTGTGRAASGVVLALAVDDWKFWWVRITTRAAMVFCWNENRGICS